MTEPFASRLRSRAFRAALHSGVAAAAFALLFAPSSAQTFDLKGANTTLPAAPNFPSPYLSGAVNITNSGSAAILTEGGGTAASATYTGSIADGAGTVGLTHTSGVTVLSGVNTYSGPTNILGGSLAAGSTTGISQNTLLTISSGATLDLNGFNATAANLAGAGTLTNNGSQGAWLYTNFGSASTTFSGDIVDGQSPVGLISTGQGVLTLSGVNTNSLSTQMVAGTLKAGSSTGLSPNASVNFVSASTIDINGFNSTINGLTGGNGGVVTNNGAAAATLSINSSSSLTFYGSVQDGASPLALTITGNGIQTLSGYTNNYSGVTTINSGATLQFGDGNSYGSFGTGAIVDNGALWFQQGSGAGTQINALSASISGTGSVLQQGPGTVTLTGVNTFTGGVVVNPDTNNNPSWYTYQLLFGSPSSLPTAAFPGGGALTLSNGGVAGTTYALDQNFLDAVATGSVGALALGADSANNLNFDSPSLTNVSLGAASAQCDSGFYCALFNYTGTLTANGDGAGVGVYQFGGGNAILNVAGNLTDQIGSTRSLVQGANGIGGYTILSGVNSYTGGTTITSGVLQFGSASAVPQLGTPSININAFGVVAAGYALDQPFLDTITPTSQGVVALAYTDTSPGASATVLDFNTPGLANISLGAVGTQTYYGSILPYVAAGGALGSFQLGGGTATNNFYSALTVAGTLTDANAAGPGSTNQLIVNPQAFATPINVILTANETYSGATIVQGGTLTLGNGTLNGNLLNTSSVQLQNFSTLTFQEGAGPVTFDRLITGNGYVTQAGPGTVTLTQVETYGASSPSSPNGYAIGGGTYISGGTLALGPHASIASSSFVALQNPYNNAPPPTLDISAGGNQTIQYLFGTQNTVVSLGANTLTIGGVAGEGWLSPGGYVANPNNSNNVEPDFLGSITGTGGVVFQLPQALGQPAYVLGGTNSYSGPTTIASGTVQAGGPSVLSPNSSLNVQSGATLDLAGYSQTIGSLSGAGVVTNSVSAPVTLTVGGDNSSTTFSGLISDIGAAGSLQLEKIGTGTFTLTGANTYVGGTLVQGGELVVGASGALGTGPVTIAAGGAVQFGTATTSLSNPIVLSGSGVQTIDTGSQTVTLSGAITGAGALGKIGSGELILTGADTFTGGVNLGAGTLGVAAGGALGSGAVTMSPGTGLQFTGGNLGLANAIALNGAGNYSFDTGANTDGLSGAISGAGTLKKLGSGTLILSGANSFTGAIDVTAGTLAIDGASALGAGAINLSDGTTLQSLVGSLDITNAVALLGPDPTIDTGAGTVTVTTPITGAGALTKLGTGSLILTATNTYTGGTNVNVGTLEVDGSIATSPLASVASGATLSGVGVVNSVNVSSGGTLAAGNAATPYGTLTAKGSLTLPVGSLYSVNLSPGSVGLVSATGTANVAGSVVVNGVAGAYNPLTKYTILTAAGGVTGTFGLVTLAGLPGYSGVLSYDPKDVFLQVIPGGNPAPSIEALALARESQLVNMRILGSLLIGANEQVNCSSCASGFASVGSFSIGTHGRWALSDRLTLLAGVSFDEFTSDGAHVTNAPIIAGSLRYDLADWGRSRPYFEAGATVAPYEVSNYTRKYAYGGGVGTGTGSTVSRGLSAFGRVGWVWRASPIDEIAAYGDLNRSWQQTNAYSEATGLLNPQPATFAGGVDAFNIARIGAQYTHLFGSNLEVNGNLAIARGFGAQVGVDASVAGFGLVPNLSVGSSTWAEFGGRLGYRVTDKFVIDAFMLGTAGALPGGHTLHGGFGLRYAF